MTILEIIEISKYHQRRLAVERVSFSLGQAEILCLLGPSGSGKTSLLRLIAGLDKPDDGRILFAGVDQAPVPPHLRQFGMMFQEFALFPHKNVLKNVLFGLEMATTQPNPSHERAEFMLRLVGLEGVSERSINDLSGGERQRVALARCLAPSPKLLLLDEPLGSLDRPLRERLIHEIAGILKKVGLPAIFVTHDQSEAFAAADRIAIMNQGRIIQLGHPEDIYRFPRNEIVAEFLGFTNRLPGRVLKEDLVRTGLGDFPLPVPPPEAFVWNPGDRVTVVFRPEAAFLPGNEEANPGPVIRGTVRERVFIGRYYRVVLDTPAGPLTFDLDNTTLPPSPERPVELAIRPNSISLIPESRET